MRCIFFIRIVLKLIIKRIGVRAAQTDTLLDDLAVDVLKSLKRYFLLSISLYVGFLLMTLETKTRVIIDKAFILFALIQFAQVSGLVINFWIGKNLN